MAPPLQSRSQAGKAQATAPVYGRFSSEKFVVGSGVAIFHIASGRVVIIYDPSHKCYVLPKGRCDIHEATPAAGEREGYEESGYRNRLLPLPIIHCQPQPRTPLDPRLQTFSCQPVAMEMVPASMTNQYVLFWHIAETLPPSIEEEIAKKEEESEGSVFGKPYVYPPPFPVHMTLKERLQLEPKGYQPVKHEDTTNDEEEMLYESELVDVEEACEKLGKGSTMEDVVRRGWELICARSKMEDGSL